MKRILKKFLLGLTVLFTIFYSSYILTRVNINNKGEEQEKVKEEVQKELSLDDNTKICLYKGEDLEGEKSLSELRKEFNLDESITEEELSNTLQTMGYVMNEKTGNEIYYTREIEESLESNKYYIKEYEGYLAIYKTDSSGKCTIENPQEDIFKKGKKFADLPEGDKEMINNLELVYDTKDEALLDISDIVS